MKNGVIGLFAATLACGCFSLAPSLQQGTSLVLTPRISAGRTNQTQVSPYTQSSIAHLVIKLYSRPGLQEIGQRDLVNAQLGNPIVFGNLKSNSQYRIQAFAYKAGGTATGDLISTTDPASWVDVDVFTDDRPAIAQLNVQLVNIGFSGQASGTIQITPGGYELQGPEAAYFRHTQVSTLTGTPGASGSVNGSGFSAQFNKPYGVVTDATGNIFVADEENQVIRKITPDGVVSTLAGKAGVAGTADGTGTDAQFNYPVRLTVDPAGNLYVSDYLNHAVRKITAAGVVSTMAGQAGASGTANGNGSNARFRYPCGITLDSSGNLYVADSGNGSIRFITPAGDVTTFTGIPGSFGSTDGTNGVAKFANPYGITRASDGNLFVTDKSVNTIRKISSTGTVTTIAGAYNVTGSEDGPATSARFRSPHDLVVDGAGNLFIADAGNYTIRRLGTSGIVTTLAGQALASGSVDAVGSAAKFNHPVGIGFDKAGNLLVTEYYGHDIRLLQ